MLKTKTFTESKFNKKFLEDVTPTKISEARRVKLNSEGWGLIVDYHLESVKINWANTGEVHSTATLKVGDRSGYAVCLVRGPSVGILFGMAPHEWTEVEKLCGARQQLFYRYFKDGISQNFRFEQRLFYSFCLSSQKTDLFVAVFRRGTNKRKKDRGDPFLEILELRKCDPYILDLYVNHLRNDVENVLTK